MFAANTYLIQPAEEEDAGSLARLAALSSRAPLTGRALIGHLDGAPAAAISLADGAIITDPLLCTGHLVACLRVRAHALRAYETTPSLRLRMLAGVPGGTGAGTTAERTSKQEAAARVRAADRRGRRRRGSRDSLVVSS